MSLFIPKNALKKILTVKSELADRPPTIKEVPVVKVEEVKEFNRQTEDHWFNVKAAFDRLQERVNDLENKNKSLEARVTALE
jgi:FtsZ-binding cell division protein ZapB